MVATLGFNKSTRDRNLLIRSSAGATAVVECEVTQYLNKNLVSFSFIEPNCIWRKLCLNIWTTLSASPLLKGWHGAVQICLLSFSAIKDVNVEPVKDDPLSVTIFCGNPCVANKSEFCFSVP